MQWRSLKNEANGLFSPMLVPIYTAITRNAQVNMHINEAFVAVGANLPSGDLEPVDSVPAAIAQLVARVGGSHKISRLYHTPAFPKGSGPPFVNAAVQLQWSGTATDLLAILHEIEEAFGRTRTHRWEARVMDLDLIGLGDVILPDPQTRASWANLPPERAAEMVPDQLILPHPRLADRGFVLVPLADIAPDWRDPATGVSVAQMLAARPALELAEILPVPLDAQ